MSDLGVRSLAVRRAILALALAPLLGCHGDRSLGVVCAPTLGEAVVVLLRDAGTGTPLADGARGAVTEGSFVDSLRAMPLEGPPRRTLVGGRDREGTYVVTVDRQGYRPWRADAVRVTRGVCGVNTVGLVAELQPSP